jgi:uncharacterized protein YabE (DUF348 family)
MKKRISKIVLLIALTKLLNVRIKMIFFYKKRELKGIKLQINSFEENTQLFSKKISSLLEEKGVEIDPPK